MRRDLFIITALVLAVVAVYGQTLGHEFVWIDDRAYITGNLTVMRGLRWDGVLWAFTTMSEVNWHPLTWLSHMLDVSLWGDWAGGHHLTNVVLHALNSVMVFLVVRGFGRVGRVGFESGAAFGVAMLFAVHPMHVESVAWVAERKDVLCAFFFLLTLGAYGRYASGGRDRLSVARDQAEGADVLPITDHRPPITSPRAWYLLTLLLFALALLAKPMAVTLPFVLLLLDWWPLGRRMNEEGRRIKAGSRLHPSSVIRHPFLKEKLPFFALSLASCVVTSIAQRSAMAPIEHIGIAHRLANAVVSYAAYLRKLVWPLDLCMDYPYREHISYAQLGVSAVLLAGVTVLALGVRKRHPQVLVGWFWYLGMLVPVIGVVQVGRAAMADRYAYLPFIGIYVALVWTVRSLLFMAGCRRLAVLIAIAALTTGTVLAHRQAAYWRDTIALYDRTLAIGGPSEVALIALAGGLSDEGRFNEALARLEEAVRMGPNTAETLGYLAMTLAKMQRYEEAVQRAQAALTADPGHIPAYGALGEAQFALGRTNEAVAAYGEGLQRAPGTSYLHYDMGKVSEAAGRYDEAVVAYRQALAQAPGNWLQRLVLADALAKAGQPEQAGAELDRAVADSPRTDQSRSLIAAAYLTLAATREAANRPGEAIAAVRKAQALDPGALAPRRELLLILCRTGAPEAAAAAADLYRALQRIDFSAVEVANDLAWVQATHPRADLRNPAQAVELAERAARLSGYRNPTVLDTLAAAYAAAGQFQAATYSATRALQLAGQQGQRAQAEAIQQRLARYGEQTPFVDTSLHVAPVEPVGAHGPARGPVNASTTR